MRFQMIRQSSSSFRAAYELNHDDSAIVHTNFEWIVICIFP
jgi:hypothetical protein